MLTMRTEGNDVSIVAAEACASLLPVPHTTEVCFPSHFTVLDAEHNRIPDTGTARGRAAVPRVPRRLPLLGEETSTRRAAQVPVTVRPRMLHQPSSDHFTWCARLSVICLSGLSVQFVLTASRQAINLLDLTSLPTRKLLRGATPQASQRPEEFTRAKRLGSRTETATTLSIPPSAVAATSVR